MIFQGIQTCIARKLYIFVTFQGGGGGGGGPDTLPPFEAAHVYQPKNLMWILKIILSTRCSFEHAKQMLKLIGKNIFSIFLSNFFLSGPMHMFLC